MTAMFSWQADGSRGLESARVLLGDGGMRALGRMVRAPLDAPAFTASYRLFVDEQGVLARLSVTSATAERERNLTLNHTEDGYWLLDTGAGGSRAEFDGALDVDLQYSPLYNALPIRRTRLHREPVDHQLPIVFVSLPTLEVELASQRYRTLSTLDSDGRAVVSFSWETFAADIVVDTDGMVIEYPGLANRI
ncbi:MAG: putative glycolipid-binding domain-containing protein [Pseudonocardia sp.]|nr:putative glycolipid-binding domain-containing protein [Pseudonocardia sp.]MBO0872710.1 putative glycolipid-binding domain-containing protein [Pseudonocardia sp.]